LRQVAGSVGTAILITTMSNSAKGFAQNAGGAISAHTPALAASRGISTAFVLTIVLCLLAASLSLTLASKKKLTTSGPMISVTETR